MPGLQLIAAPRLNHGQRVLHDDFITVVTFAAALGGFFAQVLDTDQRTGSGVPLVSECARLSPKKVLPSPLGEYTIQSPPSGSQGRSRFLSGIFVLSRSSKDRTTLSMSMSAASPTA